MRRRWASVVLGMLGVLALAGCSPATAPAHVAASAVAAAQRSRVPPAIRVAGRSVPFVGLQRWTQASIASRAATTVTVFVVGSTTSGGDMCGPPAIHVQTTESARTVRVLVADYQEPAPPDTACAAVGYGPGPQTVRLQHPLGTRRLVDASTGRDIVLLDASQYPTLPEPPAGLIADPISRSAANQPTVREWSAPDHFVGVQLSSQAPATVRAEGPYGRVALQGRVKGSPATVYRGTDGSSDAWVVQWTPNNRQTLTLDIGETPGRTWTASSALALASTAVGYTASATGRLGEPDAPGTVAATYNSADGPVDDAVNLLKSSGVHVALDCVGRGSVAVQIRGRTIPITCTTGLTHHVFETTGRPFDAFRLSVRASTGVRWALSLARDSLDGS